MLNKWGKKLDKEYQKSFTEDEKAVHGFWGDVETDTTYCWKFETPENKEHCWILDKATGKISKSVR